LAETTIERNWHRMSSDLPTTPDVITQETNLPASSAPSAQYPPATEPFTVSEKADWHRYVAALWRYKYLILLVTLVGSAAGVLAARYVVKEEYEAQATIWIEATSGTQTGRGSPIRSELLLQSFAWVDLLKSYLVLDSVVVEEKLYLEVEGADVASLAGFGLKQRFRPGKYRFVVGPEGDSFELWTAGGQLLQAGARGDSVGQDRGFVWVPSANAFSPDRIIEFTVGIPREAATYLGEALQARVNERGSFLRLTLTGQNPERTADMLNAVADRYVEVAARLKTEKLKQVAAILDDQLNYAGQRLQEAEEALEEFRVQTVTLPTDRTTEAEPGLRRLLELWMEALGAGSEAGDPAYENYFAQKVQQDQLQSDREALERIVASAADSGLSVAGLEYIAARHVSSELNGALRELTDRRAELRAYRLLYTDEHPLVVEALGEIQSLEEQTIPELAERLIAELAAREAELAASISSASRDLTRIPPRAMEEAGLQRRVNIAANFYTELQLRHEEALLSEANAIPDVSLLDAAIAPLSPKNSKDKPRLIILAFLGSLSLAIAGAVVLDRVDPRLRYPEQVGLELGLPILGAVPHVAGHGVGNRSQVVEAFRVIRLNVQHAYGAAGPVVVGVTSPAAEEGKSFVAVNLGLAFAELGNRTLVIDGDVRRGRIHHLLGATRKPGLTDYLAGEASRERILQPTFSESLGCIGSGSRRQNGPELLQSSSMVSLLAELRPDYDVIIVDAPPVGIGADALALGTLTGNVVFVLRTGSTDRDMSETKLDMLERLPVRILGAILNAVPARDGYYYKYDSYLPGYEARDEEQFEQLLPQMDDVIGQAGVGEASAELAFQPERVAETVAVDVGQPDDEAVVEDEVADEEITVGPDEPDEPDGAASGEVPIVEEIRVHLPARLEDVTIPVAFGIDEADAYLASDQNEGARETELAQGPQDVVESRDDRTDEARSEGGREDSEKPRSRRKRRKKPRRRKVRS